jgi:pimeloyl-ACP methyl ester carboxylesterase
MLVQTVAIIQPSLVRKLIIAGGSAVQPTPNSPKDTRDTKYMMGMATAATYVESKEAFKLALFGESREGAEAFANYWQRLQQRSAETPMLDPVPLDKGANNQIRAVLNADKPENGRWPDPLAALKMPVLIANGNNDLTLGLVRTLDLHARLSNSQLVLFPNSGHGFLWQYGTLFAEQITLFLDSDAFDIA